jgi:hypothetical protein
VCVWWWWWWGALWVDLNERRWSNSSSQSSTTDNSAPTIRQSNNPTTQQPNTPHTNAQRPNARTCPSYPTKWSTGVSRSRLASFMEFQTHPNCCPSDRVPRAPWIVSPYPRSMHRRRCGVKVRGATVGGAAGLEVVGGAVAAAGVVVAAVGGLGLGLVCWWDRSAATKGASMACTARSRTSRSASRATSRALICVGI